MLSITTKHFLGINLQIIYFQVEFAKLPQIPNILPKLDPISFDKKKSTNQTRGKASYPKQHGQEMIQT